MVSQFQCCHFGSSLTHNHTGMQDDILIRHHAEDLQSWRLRSDSHFHKHYNKKQKKKLVGGGGGRQAGNI